ncbi:MAG: ATP-binding cassette domain-containing protein [Actinomycetota bacterium]
MEEIELVEIEDLSYRYPGGADPALRGVSLTLREGEFVLLLGRSGSGKSTLCRAVNGLVPHFYGGRISGSVRVAGVDTTRAEVRDLARTVGMVFQDPENQMVTENPTSEIAFGCENIGLERLQMRKRVEEVLANLRLSPLRDRRVAELSGGEKQKVALASVLVMHPRVLVLDEPTSQLDPISAGEFLSTLKSLNDELGLAVLLAEHRVERCFHLADRVVVLEGGRVAFDGEPAEMASWAREKPWVPLPPITRLFSHLNGASPPLTVKEGRLRVTELARGGEPAGPDSHGPSTAQEAGVDDRLEGEAPGPRVEVKGLWHIYGDGTEALRDIDLSIRRGEFLAIIGENGSGKSTLVKHFNGILLPVRGEVRIEGLDTRGVEVAKLAASCGMLPQNPNLQLIADDTDRELKTTLEARGFPADSWDGMVEETLGLLGLERFRFHDPATLSCGQRELVALASVVVARPPVLILDEPSRGVDQGTKERLGGFLRRYNEEGNTVVLVTHDLEFAAQWAGRVLLMGSGRVLADGDKHTVLAESLFFTTQYNKCFRAVNPSVVTRDEAAAALEALS